MWLRTIGIYSLSVQEARRLNQDDSKATLKVKILGENTILNSSSFWALRPSYIPNCVTPFLLYGHIPPPLSHYILSTFHTTKYGC